MLVPADPQLIDTLAVFGAGAEDREMDLEDERDEEPDDPEARERFTRARQLPGVTHNGITGRYDISKDWDELRRMERAVARSSARR